MDETAQVLLTHYTMMEQLEDLEAIFHKVLQFSIDTLGDKHSHVADRCSDLALLYRRKEDYETATYWQQRALDIKIHCDGSREGLEYAGVVNLLAEIHQELGHFDIAETHFSEALKVSIRCTQGSMRSRAFNEKNAKHGNQGMLLVALVMTNLGLLYREKGNVKLRPLPKMIPTEPGVEVIDYFAKATPLFEKALSLRKEVLGEANLLYAESLDNLGVCYQLQGRVAEAEPLSQKSNTIKFESDTVRELKLLRQLMTEGQGVVQQELDHHKAFLDRFTENLAKNKVDAIRNEERMDRLKRKYREALQFIADEIEEWNGKFKACEEMPKKTMTQEMKRDTVKLFLRKDYEEVKKKHAELKLDREELIKKRAKVIKANIADRAKMKRQVEVSAKEVIRLEQLLRARYSKVIKKAFFIFDKDKSGDIDPEECREVIDALEPDMPEAKKIHLCKTADKDGDGSIDYEEFIALLLRRETNFDQLKKEFELADVDGSGSIDPEELRAVIAKVDPTMSEVEIAKAMKEADKDGDGQIGYDEFLAYMRKRAGLEDVNHGEEGKTFLPTIIYGQEQIEAAERIQRAARIKQAREKVNKKRREHRMIMGSKREHAGMC